MTETAGGARQRPALARAQDGAARRRQRVDRMMHSVLLVSAGFSVLIIALVVVFLVINARPVLSHVGLGSFFGSTDWAPDGKSGFGGDSTYGALSPILGSLVVVGGALVVAVPVAVCAALFLEETNPLVGERYLRPAVELFVGIPSVVYGYLGFIALLPILRHLAPPGRDGSGLLAGAVVLGVMIVPTIATLSADGLRAVPRSMREASLALGATRWQTMRRILLPAARPGIVSGIVLGLARAMGEALAVALVIGDVNTIPLFRAHGIRALIEPWTTMTVTITDGVNQVAINPDGTAARYMLALVLLVITFACIVVVRRVQRPQEVAA